MYIDFVLLAWFFIIAVFSERNNSLAWVIVFFIVLFNVITSYTTQYIHDVVTAGMLSSSCAFFISCRSCCSKQAVKQCLILCMASFAHMLQYADIIRNTNYIYDWYEVVLFALALAQMVASKDGLINAIHNIKNTFSAILPLLQRRVDSSYGDCSTLDQPQKRVFKA